MSSQRTLRLWLCCEAFFDLAIARRFCRVVSRAQSALLPHRCLSELDKDRESACCTELHVTVGSTRGRVVLWISCDAHEPRKAPRDNRAHGPRAIRSPAHRHRSGYASCVHGRIRYVSPSLIGGHARSPTVERSVIARRLAGLA